MTRDEIQAEWDSFIEYPEGSGKLYVTTTSALIFAHTIAAMAAAAERKRIETSRPPRMSVSIERARQEEREACAKLCDERSAGWDQVKIVRDDVEACMNAAAKNEARALGSAIRARNPT